jgi:hypothetical protein
MKFKLKRRLNGKMKRIVRRERMVTGGRKVRDDESFSSMHAKLMKTIREVNEIKLESERFNGTGKNFIWEGKKV